MSSNSFVSLSTINCLCSWAFLLIFSFLIVSEKNFSTSEMKPCTFNPTEFRMANYAIGHPFDHSEWKRVTGKDTLGWFSTFFKLFTKMDNFCGFQYMLIYWAYPEKGSTLKVKKKILHRTNSFLLELVAPVYKRPNPCRFVSFATESNPLKEKINFTLLVGCQAYEDRNTKIRTNKQHRICTKNMVFKCY